jgi:hypothetical protein
MKISDVLWKVANENLWDGHTESRFNQVEFICCGVGSVYGGETRSLVEGFLSSLGMGLTGTSFSEVSVGRKRKYFTEVERQQVRYAWLMFASMIAEEWEL